MAAIVHIVSNGFPNIRKALPVIAKAVAKIYIDNVYHISQELVPVDEGKLKASGHTEELPSGYKLVYDAKNTSGVGYGGYVEYGTSVTRAQPYLTPAAQQALGSLQQNLNVENLIAEMM